MFQNIIYLLLIVFQCESKLYQGPTSISKAKLVQEKILQTAEKYRITLRNDMFLEKFETEDSYYQRSNIKCNTCQKFFKNSSMLMLHYHRFHLSDEENQKLVDLNYLCLFIRCDENQNIKQQEEDYKNKMCMEFVSLNVLNGSTWNITKFCDDLVLDRDFLIQGEWEPLIKFLQQLGFIAFIFISLIYEYQIYVYLKFKSGIKRRKARQQEALQKYYHEDSDEFTENDHLISIYQ